MFKTVALAAIATLALTGCIKHEPHGGRPDGHEGGNGGREEEKLLLTKRTDWSIRYMGRQDVSYDDGTTAVLEEFHLACTDAVYVFPLIISPDDLKNVYDNDLLSFFDYEVKLLQQDAQANPNTALADLGVYSAKQSSVWFSRHMHGTWILYVAELDRNLNLTGQYAEHTFTIPEEEASEGFKRWYGSYHVSDGYSAFDITVSDADANYLYYIDGWETGPSVSQQMDGERDWIYARYDNGKLIFYAQFLQTEDYDGTTVDEVFAGTWLTATSDKVGDLDWEGVDYEDPVAYTVQEGETVTLQPTTVTFDNGYQLTYNGMRYSRLWFTDNGNTVNWAYYNTAGVPTLPATMEYIPGTRANSSAPAVRLRTKGTVHRDQLKPARLSRVRKWTEK